MKKGKEEITPSLCFGEIENYGHRFRLKMEDMDRNTILNRQKIVV